MVFLVFGLAVGQSSIGYTWLLAFLGLGADVRNDFHWRRLVAHRGLRTWPVLLGHGTVTASPPFPHWKHGIKAFRAWMSAGIFLLP